MGHRPVQDAGLGQIIPYILPDDQIVLNDEAIDVTNMGEGDAMTIDTIQKPSYIDYLALTARESIPLIKGLFDPLVSFPASLDHLVLAGELHPSWKSDPGPGSHHCLSGH